MICGHCKAPAAEVAAVKACAAGEAFPCGWLIQVPFQWVEDPESGELFDVEAHVRECGAHAVATERGWSCEAGHEHVNAWTRHAEGWDFAEDFGEARNLAAAGVEPRTMSGHIVLGEASFANPWGSGA